MSIRRFWKKLVIGSPIVMLVALLAWWSPTPAFALTTADINVTATPEYISITATNTTYDFGTVTAGGVTNTTTAYFPIVNASTVQTDQTISVTTNTWTTAGVAWTHSDTATAGIDTAGLKAAKGGAWGAADIVVKFAAPNYIAENQAATTNYSFGLQLYAPTSFSDGVQKSIIVRITAAAG